MRGSHWKENCNSVCSPAKTPAKGSPPTSKSVLQNSRVVKEGANQCQSLSRLNHEVN